LYPEAPAQAVANCEENGVLGATAGLIAMVQAAETVKWILGAGGLLAGRVLVVDTWSASFREYKLSKNSDCANHGAKTRAAQEEKRPMAEKIPQMPVEELKRRIDAGNAPFILDVREPHEHARANLNETGAEIKLIPLGELPARVHELDPERETVVHCRSGGRSQSAAEHLQAVGFKKVHNLAGGIGAWSDRVDPKVPKY
jgi:adenylyltransferase/sulfurtransferase